MGAVPPASRPIIVCGMARAGTSLVGQLVRSAEDVVLFPEMSPHAVPAMFDLLAQVRATLTGQSWREFTPADVDARVVELLRRIWGAGRDTGRGDDAGQARFGLKQPHAEEFAERFAEVLGPHRPQFVYALRDPRDVYRSTMRWFPERDVDPKRFRAKFLRSVETALRLRDTGDLTAFDVDAATDDTDRRRTLTAATFGFLGITATRRTANFVARWPDINRTEGANRGGLGPAEIERRVAGFAGGRAFRRLTEAVEHLSAR